MRQRQTRFVFFFLLLGALAVPAAADQPAAARLAAEGETLLRSGDVAGAAVRLRDAARAHPENAAIVERALVLRRVVSLERFVAGSATGERWETAVASLHRFYLENGIPARALPMDRAAHERLGTDASAARLAETFLALGRDADVTTLLAERASRVPRLAVFHAIALARLGLVTEARTVRDRLAAPAPEDAAARFDRACLAARLGEPDEALALLADAFRHSPERAHGAMRRRVGVSADLAMLASNPRFERALATPSEVREACSGGSDCGSCPNRGRCGG